jgi:hypothetical protein
VIRPAQEGAEHAELVANGEEVTPMAIKHHDQAEAAGSTFS